MSEKSWGKDIWEDKAKSHGAAGVVFGTGFSLSSIERQTRKYLPVIEKMFLNRLAPKARILDAGVGPLARFAHCFAQRGFNVVGLDIAPESLKSARQAAQAAGQSIELIEGDILKLERFKQSFEGVFCFESFYHIPSHLSLEALKQIHGCLKPEGLALIQFAVQDDVSIQFLLTQVAYFTVFKIARPVLRAFGRKSFQVTVTRHSTAEIRDMARLAGFEVEDQRQTLFMLKKRVAEIA